jgi:hypothetical protein
MPNYDLFNGDADGICSLIQLRLAQPREANLVTGVKRDIKLLNSLKAEAGDNITVLDVSMDKNQTGLLAALNAGANVFYADHHQSGEIPDHPALEAYINTAANTCTGLIIDYYLKGQYREWAIVAAYGDNINQVADEYATYAELTDEQRQQLRALGVAMNYNGYGASEEDLFYHPADLYKLAAPYQSPFDFIKERADVYKTLTEGYATDLEKGLNITPVRSSDNAAMIMLPNEQWARRISGVLGNELANQYPDRAHAILTEREEQVEGPGSKKEKTYLVSIRAAKSNLVGADTIAVKFGGGGRKGAAGIDRMLETDIDTLWAEFT